MARHYRIPEERVSMLLSLTCLLLVCRRAADVCELQGLELYRGLTWLYMAHGPEGSALDFGSKERNNLSNNLLYVLRQG